MAPSVGLTCSKLWGLTATHPKNVVGPRAELGCGPLREFRRPTGLLDPARVHDEHLIGHSNGLVLIVRDRDRRDVHLRVAFLHELAKFGAHDGVECTEGFVEEKNARLDRALARAQFTNVFLLI